jgi:hypothetical protein
MSGPTPAARFRHALGWFFTLSECTTHARNAQAIGYWACIRMSKDNSVLKVESRGLTRWPTELRIALGKSV